MKILFNSGIEEYSWLSNFEPCPVTDLHGVVWPSSEHCYQASKTHDEHRDVIRACATAAATKKAIRKMPIRNDWHDIKIEVMRRILVAKFTQNPEFYVLLMNTEGVELIEHAPWDKFWGDGGDGRGKNHMGKILMVLRDAWLKEEPARPVHEREAQPGAEYIGRAGHGHDGYFGNPYAKFRKCERCGVSHQDNGSTLGCFAAYFWDRITNDPDYKESVLKLKGAELACFCKGKGGVGNPCHGDIISLWLNNYGAAALKE